MKSASLQPPTMQIYDGLVQALEEVMEESFWDTAEGRAVQAVKAHELFQLFLAHVQRTKGVGNSEWELHGMQTEPLENLKEFNAFLVKLGKQPMDLTEVKQELAEVPDNPQTSSSSVTSLLEQARSHPSFNDYLKYLRETHDPRASDFDWTFGTKKQEDLQSFNEFLALQSQEKLDLSAPEVMPAKPSPCNGSGSSGNGNGNTNTLANTKSKPSDSQSHWPLGLTVEVIHQLDEDEFWQAVKAAQQHPLFEEYWREVLEEVGEDDMDAFDDPDGDPLANLEHWVLWLQNRGLKERLAFLEAQVIADVEITSAARNGWGSIFTCLETFDDADIPDVRKPQSQAARKGRSKVCPTMSKWPPTTRIRPPPNPPSPINILESCGFVQEVKALQPSGRPAAAKTFPKAKAAVKAEDVKAEESFPHDSNVSHRNWFLKKNNLCVVVFSDIPKCHCPWPIALLFPILFIFNI